MLSSIHLVIFRHPYLTHMKFLEVFSAMNLALHSLYIYHLDFHLKERSFPQTLKRFYGVTSFSRYFLIEIILYKNQDGICFLWGLELWILIIQPSHPYTLAYCRPILLISIEFQNIDNDHGSPHNFFFPFYYYYLAIREVTLTKIFSTNYYCFAMLRTTIEILKIKCCVINIR
jgi:hypothetical protein